MRAASIIAAGAALAALGLVAPAQGTRHPPTPCHTPPSVRSEAAVDPFAGGRRRTTETLTM